MCNARGKLAERCQLLGLNEAILGVAEIIERLREFPRAILHLSEQSSVLDRDDGLVGEGLD